MRVILPVCLLALAASCARVQPWERGHLASAAMQVGLGDPSSVSAAYRAKVPESKTGGGLPGTAPGGGCGCTQ
jgi:hypothetical protein